MKLRMFFVAALAAACAIADETVKFGGEIAQGMEIADPGGKEQSFVCWFKSEGAGKGDKPYDRIVQTPNWYVHTVAASDEVEGVTFGYTGGDGKTHGFSGLDRKFVSVFGRWQHLAVTFGKGGYRVYLNGIVVSGRDGKDSYGRNLPGTLRAGNACLGNNGKGGNRPFKGQISGAKFFAKELSAGRIAKMAKICPDGKPLEALIVKPPSAEEIIPTVDITGDSFRQTVIAEGTAQLYQGHPTTLLAPGTKTLFCVWTKDHGGPCGPMARSDDGGRTWRRLDAELPEAYSKFHRNCPVLQQAKGPDGKLRYFVYSGDVRRGMGVLTSEDGGATWAERPRQAHLSAAMPPTGFMELKDGTLALFGQVFKKRDRALDRASDDQAVWMSVSRDGGFTWGEMRIVAQAEKKNLCEPCCLRSPDGNELVLLMRENRHRGKSMMCFSRDEGKTWSAPHDTPWALTGDRHEGVMLPDGRYVIAFRDRAPESKTLGQYVAWVGTWSDMRECRPGQYRIHLLKHHPGKGPNANSFFDTGYSGVELLPDGEIVCTTYSRHFDDNRKSSVVATRFRIEETDGKWKAVR